MDDPGRRLLDDLLAAVGCGVLVVDPGDDRVVHASPRAEELLGSRDVVGRPLATVAPAPGRSLRCDEAATDERYGYVVVMDEAGSHARDEELAFLRRAVDRLDSLALAEHAAAAVSHDLNNVLQSVVGLTQLALEDPSAETLESLNEAASHASRLSRLLLETGRPRPDGSPDCDPVAALVRIEPVLECLARRRLRLEPSPTGRVALPRPALERIVINLAANARDATVAGGTVTIRTRADGDEAIVQVEDTGAGMDRETLAQAKDLSFTTKPDGTGLGLALVHRIVRRYGGTLQLDSEPGRGTRVTVRVPRVVS